MKYESARLLENGHELAHLSSRSKDVRDALMASTAYCTIRSLTNHRFPFLLLPRPPVHRISWNIQPGKHIFCLWMPSSIELSEVFLNRFGLIFIIPAIVTTTCPSRHISGGRDIQPKPLRASGYPHIGSVGRLAFRPKLLLPPVLGSVYLSPLDRPQRCLVLRPPPNLNTAAKQTAETPQPRFAVDANISGTADAHASEVTGLCTNVTAQDLQLGH